MNEPLHLLTALFQSFYSAEFYRRAARWRGKAFVYLGVVLALCWLPILIQAQVRFARIFQKADQTLIAALPTIRFEKGTVTTTENRPYVFRVGESAESLGIIIDTSGHYTSLDGQQAQILVTSHQCFLRQRTGEVRVYDLSKSQSNPFTLDQAFYHRTLQILKRWSATLLFTGAFILSYFKRLIQALLIAILGLGVSAALEAELDLGELLNLAIVAMTPAMILETGIALAGKPFAMEWVFAGGLILAYFIFAINATSDTGSQE